MKTSTKHSLKILLIALVAFGGWILASNWYNNQGFSDVTTTAISIVVLLILLAIFIWMNLWK